MQKMSIVCSDDDERSYCNYCDALIVEVNKKLICSGCGVGYEDDSVRFHKMELQPAAGKGFLRNDGPEVVGMTEYTNTQKKKTTVFDKEDRLFQTKGRYFTQVEDYPSD